jgi:hypothetical protein
MRTAILLLLGLGLLAGCATPAQRAEAQIREHIFSIRDAIRARQPEGIVRWGTDDWSFTGADGKAFGRAAYLDRARGMFARIVTLDSLETTVDRVEIRGPAAEVEITQLMERHERDPATGAVTHLRLRYREQHDWVRTPEGWRVRAVRFIGTPERTVLD